MSPPPHRPSKASTRLVVALLALLAFTVGGTALLGILMIATKSDADSDYMLLANGVMANAYVALMLAAAYVIRAGRLIPLMIVAIVFAPIGFTAFTIVIWHERSMQRQLEMCFGGIGLTATSAAVAMVHAGIFAWLQTKVALLHWARWAVVGVTSSAGAVLLTAFWSDFFELTARPPFMLFGVFQVLLMLAFLGTLLVPLAILLVAKREAARAESLSRRKIVMTCPRCATEQELSSGPCWCNSCGFTMIIEIHEPRCECGYLLFKLEGNSCPECGRAVQRFDQPLSSVIASEM